MTLYQQTIDANTGIDASQFIPGYSHEDGIRFDKNDSVNTMMEKMADKLVERRWQCLYFILLELQMITNL